MRIASVLGGGVAGVGEICGAISGAVIALGLQFGSNGTESMDEFKVKRTAARDLIQKYLNKFENAWGSLRCETLIAMDKGKLPLTGSKRHEDNSMRNRCDEYVKWSCETITTILDSHY